MKKHIIGLIIFTLIVGTSVVIAGLFGISKTTKRYVHKHENHKVYKKKKRKKRCRKKRRGHNFRNIKASVSQAVFDKNTNELITSLTFNKSNFDNKNLDLHFFVKDEFGTQYLKKETISISGQENVYTNSFGWLNRLESRENLYVIPMVRNSRRGFDYQPMFNASEATPVQLKTAG